MSPAQEIQNFKDEFDKGFPGHAPSCVEAMSDERLGNLAKSGALGAVAARAEIRRRTTARLRAAVAKAQGGVR